MPGARSARHAGGRYEEGALQNSRAEGTRHARGKNRRQAHRADGGRVPRQETRQGVCEVAQGQQGRGRDLQAVAHRLVGLQPGGALTSAMDERLKANLDAWNLMAGIHATSREYRLAEFKAGENVLKPIELRELGDVRGKSLLHMQCISDSTPCRGRGWAPTSPAWIFPTKRSHSRVRSAMN